MKNFENIPSAEKKEEIGIFKKRYDVFLEELNIGTISKEDVDGDFKEIKSQSQENIERSALLESPDFLNEYFEKRGYFAQKPRPIANKKGTTLFTTAGVQAFESIIFEERDFDEKKMFVAQPVFRTQFIDKVGEGTSSSFINISTGIINPTIDEHFESFREWIEMLNEMGLDRESMNLKFEETSPTWGDKSFKNIEITLYYKGLELGDANFITDIPQEGRDNLVISDIGFGLERIKWAMSGGDYYKEEKGDPVIQDHIKTLAILAGSGVRPSNKEHGYRFRQLSKNIVEKSKEEDGEIESLVRDNYREWKKWTFLDIPESGVVKAINDENERNRKQK